MSALVRMATEALVSLVVVPTTAEATEARSKGACREATCARHG